MSQPNGLLICTAQKENISLIESAGKVLSQSNADKLLQSYIQLGQVLSVAGVLRLKDIEGLEELLEDPEGEEEKEITAASLESDVKRVTWREKLRKTAMYFVQRFCQVYEIPDALFSKKYPDKTRAEIAQELFADLTLLVKELMQSAPDPSSDLDEFPSMMSPMMSYRNDYTDGYMGLSKGEEISELNIVFDCPAQEESVIVEAASSNKFPVKGILFRIDEPSEAAPSVGPNLPLYISLEVAKTILPQIQGLPLDADDSLSKHANKEIAGVLQAGEIDNQDFIVHGHLFPFNQAEKVQAISDAKEKLGMSMNAKASGLETIINGKKVFAVKNIELLGANILFSDKATYRKTKLIAASSTTNVETAQEEEPMNTEIMNQLKEMQTTLLQMQSQQDTEIFNISNEVSDVKAQLSQLVVEKEQQLLAAQSENSALQKEQERQDFLADIAGIVDAKIKQFRNPSGQPPRITTPLAASASNTPSSSLQQQLIVAKAKLEGMRESGGSKERRIAASQEVTSLEQQIAMY